MKIEATILVFLMIFLLVAGGFLFYLNKLSSDIPKNEKKYCEVDSDCVPASCCHATDTINKEYVSVCNVLCTEVCSGPLDCGCGEPACENNRCGIRKLRDESYCS